MDAPVPYLQAGIFQISLANLVLILVMLLLFFLALVVPMPGHRGDTEGDRR